MSTRANPRVIGAFVVGAIALAVGGLIFFGGGQFFKSTVQMVMFFQGSVGGLAVGAPVTFDGVKIGQVTKVEPIYDSSLKDDPVLIPVYIELDRPIKSVGPNAGTALADLDELIKQGLRAQLVSESMVTGQQSVNFSFFNPNKNPIKLKGLIPGIREVPTVASSFDRLKASLNNLLLSLNKMPLEEIGNKIDDSLTTLQQTLTDADVLIKHVDKAVQPTLDDAQAAMAEAKTVLQNANGLVTEIRERIELKPGQPLQKINDTLDTYRLMGQHLDGQITPISTDLQTMLKKATATLDQGYALLDTLERDVARNPALLSEVTSTLREFKSAATSIRALADFLRNNPNSLLTGKR
jgi:paraquat-inducible protein B